MNKQEYEQLVRKSRAFRKMSPKLQQRILRAEGAQMEKYIVRFQEEQELTGLALQRFQQETDAIVGDYKVGVKKDKRKKLVVAEASSQQEDFGKAEDLLKNL